MILSPVEAIKRISESVIVEMLVQNRVGDTKASILRGAHKSRVKN
jgi:hypothetical protein